MGRLQRLLSYTPMGRYISAVEKGTEEKNEDVEHQSIIADIHASRLRYLVYERNHITPMVTSLVQGRHRRA